MINQPGSGSVGRDATINGYNTVTIQAGRNVTIEQEAGTLTVNAEVTNPNLLHNWYFVNPVNRNGLTEYAAPGYAIDRWTATVAGGIVLTEEGVQPTGTAGPALVQFFEPGRIPAGAQVTFSLLADGELLAGTSTWDGDYKALVGEGTNDLGVRLAIHAGSQYVQIYVPGADKPYFKAAKLELGGHQTLAHQEDGVWVLNEVPDYAGQYAICEQYSPTNGEFVGSRHVNRNLLDNWYFVGGGSQLGSGHFPINQRGLTEYAGSVYGIDRWYGPAKGTVELASGGLNVNFTALSQIQQTIEAGKAPPGTYTLSVLYKSDKPIRLYEMKPRVIGYKDFPASDGLEIAAHTFSFTDSADDLMVFVQAQAANVPINATLVAAKLELGDHQTLAHQEDGVWVLNEVPDYGEELAKCQRYQWIPDEALTINLFPGGDGTQRGNLYFPVTMRASPVLTFRAYGNTSVSETLNVRLDSGVAQKDGASFYASGASGSYVRVTEIAANANL